MPEGDGGSKDELTHRVQQAFDRMHKRVKNLELVTVSRQQLEDLLQLVPEVATLGKRIGRIENQNTMAQRSRADLIDNDNLLASEMMFIRERLLKIEGSLSGWASSGESIAASASSDPAPSA